MYVRHVLNGWTLSCVTLLLLTAGCSAPGNVSPDETPSAKAPTAEPVAADAEMSESTAETAPAAPDATEPTAPATESQAAETEAPDSEATVAEEQVPLAASDAAEGTEDELPAVTALSGKEFVTVMEETVGKVTILNLWATWCPPCVKEMPDLVRIYNETDRDEVAFVSLSLDGVAEISGTIPPFQKEHDVPFPIYVLSDRDDEAMLKAIKKPFRGGIPVTYIYDKSGKNVSMTEGPITIKELHEILAPLL